MAQRYPDWAFALLKRASAAKTERIARAGAGAGAGGGLAKAVAPGQAGGPCADDVSSVKCRVLTVIFNKMCATLYDRSTHEFITRGPRSFTVYYDCTVMQQKHSFMQLLVYECLLLLYFSVHSTQKFVSAS